MLTEASVWHTLKAGDISSLRYLYDTYADQLYQYGMALIKDSDKVKDSIHDLFVSIWSGRERISEPQSWKAYLMSSLRRKLFDKGTMMESLTETTDTISDHNLFLPDHESKWIEDDDVEKQNRKLEKAMSRLSARQQEIIHMKYFQQLEYEEIGKIMDLNYQSARNLVTRAIAALRKEMLGIVMLLLMLK